MPSSVEQRPGLATDVEAFVLEGAEVLTNEFGTAPGQWLEWNGKSIIFFPGPPHELEPMFDVHVLPRLEPFRRGYLFHKTLKISGLTESAVEDLMAGLYPVDPALEVTTLAKPGQIEIHLRSLSSAGRQEAFRRPL